MNCIGFELIYVENFGTYFNVERISLGVNSVKVRIRRPSMLSSKILFVSFFKTRKWLFPKARWVLHRF